MIASAAVHLMRAAAVKCGLAEEGDAYKDLDEARKLITALAGLVHGRAARPRRARGAAARRAAGAAAGVPRGVPEPDAPGEGPGEKLTGPV